MQIDPALGLHSLAILARALGRSASLLRLLETAAEEACEALHAASVSISRVEQELNAVRTIINAGDLGPDEVRWPVDELYPIDEPGRLAQILSELTTWTDSIEDPDSDPYELALLHELGKGSSVAAAIMVDGQVWGEFYATRHVGDKPFSEGSIDYVEVLMAILGGAISRSLQEAALEHLAFRDPLTGLFNRRGLDLRAAEAFNVPADITRAVTVIAFDINGLKHINDSQGHAGGDQLIASVAQGLLDSFDSLAGSVVARVGGDEFTVLVTGHETSQVVQLADGLCRRNWGFGSEAGVSAGASAAVITDRSPLTPAELFSAADRAQYVAKHARLSTMMVSAERF